MIPRNLTSQVLRAPPDATQNRGAQSPGLGAESLSQVRCPEAMIDWPSPRFDSNSTCNWETFLMKNMCPRKGDSENTHIFVLKYVWLADLEAPPKFSEVTEANTIYLLI